MEALEHYMQSLPYFVDRVFERWIECAAKVYRKGALPTKFLLIVGAKASLGTSGMGSFPSSSHKVLSEPYVGAPLIMVDKEPYVEVLRLAFLLRWRVHREGNEVTIEAEGRKFVLPLGKGGGLLERNGQLLLSVAELAKMLGMKLTKREDIGSLLLFKDKEPENKQ